MNPGDIDRVRVVMGETWHRTADWTEGTWQRWDEKLGRLRVEEVLAGIDHLAREGAAWPPEWGVVYRAAMDYGGGASRMGRERSQRQTDQLERERRPADVHCTCSAETTSDLARDHHGECDLVRWREEEFTPRRRR